MKQPALPRHAWALEGSDKRWSAAAVAHFAIDRFLLLPLGAAIALIWANLAGESYFTVAHRLAFPVNDVGMALFFGLLTQEIVEAVMPGGALHTWRRWTTAIVAALGGLVGAAAMYFTFVQLKYEALLLPGWPVACAIDIAAAYYLLKLLCPRSGVIPFVLLVAVITNAFVTVAIGFRDLSLEYQPIALGLFVLALTVAGALRVQQVKAFWPYLGFAGVLSWFAFYIGGMHPAFGLIPIVAFLPHEPRRRDIFGDPADDDATHHYEHEWNLLVQVILFLFGLVNAGVLLRQYDTGTWAILLAAFVGRPAGMLLGVGLAIVAGLHLPKWIGWRELVVTSLATSSGFTFALFVATSVFPVGAALATLKMGALSTVFGALLTVAAARLLHVGSRFHRHG